MHSRRVVEAIRFEWLHVSLRLINAVPSRKQRNSVNTVANENSSVSFEQPHYYLEGSVYQKFCHLILLLSSRLFWRIARRFNNDQRVAGVGS